MSSVCILYAQPVEKGQAHREVKTEEVEPSNKAVPPFKAKGLIGYQASILWG